MRPLRSPIIIEMQANHFDLAPAMLCENVLASRGLSSVPTNEAHAGHLRWV
jgi:hypothetical protein